MCIRDRTRKEFITEKDGYVQIDEYGFEASMTLEAVSYTHLPKSLIKIYEFIREISHSWTDLTAMKPDQATNNLTALSFW